MPADQPGSIASEQRMLRQPAYLVALVVAVVVALGFGLVVPILPVFARSFGVSLTAVSLVISVFAGVRLVSNLYTGGLTDRIGTRNAVGWGALIVAVSSALTASATSYGELLAYRGAGGFGSALFFNALLAHVVRIVPAEQRGRAVGGLQGAFLFGISFGPSVGGFLAEPLGLRWPFVVYGAFCALAGLVALAFLPRHERPAPKPGTAPGEEELVGATGEPSATRGGGKPEGARALLRTARELCGDRTFVIALVLMAASRWAATGVRFSLVPVFGAEVVGASPFLVGNAIALAALAQLAVVWPAGRLADTVGRRLLTVPAFIVFGVVAAGLAFATTVPLFLVAMGAYGLATGFTSVTPPAVVGDIAPPARTGAAIGVLNTAGDLGSVVGPLVSGLLADLAGYPAGFGASAAVLVLAGMAAVRMRETLPSRAP
ncbi:MAG: MFS transporter [Euzebyales bacterium]|nr:MFS transporter [Euzebyales bacterium]